jgi:STE24 endopeptidase
MQGLVFQLFLGLFAAERATNLGLAALEAWHARRAGEVALVADGLMDGVTAQRARAYASALADLALLRGLAGTSFTLAVLFSGALPRFDLLLDTLELAIRHEFVLFLAALGLVMVLLDLPFVAWRAFVLEPRFRGPRPTLAGFAVARLRTVSLALLVGIPGLYLAEASLAGGGVSGWARLLATVIVIQASLALIWPRVIAPALWRHRPLPPGPLRERLAALSASAGHPASDVRVVEGKLGQQAAQVTGLIRPVILLDAALLGRLTVDEIEGVVAHELGHVRRRHLWSRLAVACLSTVALTLPLLALAQWPRLQLAFGYPSPTMHGEVALVALCGGAFLFWLTPLGAWLSRRQEAEADREAVRLTGRPEALGAALLDLAEDHLSDPSPHPWSVAWRFSHPPLEERLLIIASAGDRN